MIAKPFSAERPSRCLYSTRKVLVRKMTGKSGGLALLAVAVLLGNMGCSKDADQTAAAPTLATDPANGNLASVDGWSQPVAREQHPAPAYPQQDSYASYSQYDSASNEQPVEASEPPPPLPEYSQPPCPGDNYIWTPGYWSYASDG